MRVYPNGFLSLKGWNKIALSSEATTLQNRRNGYTLLEVTTALAIGVMLLAAVYVAFSVLMYQSQLGRALTNRSNIARAIFTRLTNDISSHMGPTDPRVVDLPDSMFQSTDTSTTTSASTSTTTGATTTSSLTGSTTSQGGSTSSSSSSSSSGTQSDQPQPVVFNMGVQGDSQTLTLFVMEQPRPGSANANTGNTAITPPNQKRICYWLAQDGSGPLGLARQVVNFPTSEQALTQLPFGQSNQNQFIFAKQVVSVQFQYYDPDGQQWVESWDGTQAGGLDGNLPIGPPAAIAIQVQIASEALSTSRQSANQQSATRTFRHVVFIPAANGALDQAAVEAALNAQATQSSSGTTTGGQ